MVGTQYYNLSFSYAIDANVMSTKQGKSVSWKTVRVYVCIYTNKIITMHTMDNGVSYARTRTYTEHHSFCEEISPFDFVAVKHHL